MQKRNRQIGFSTSDAAGSHKLAIWGGFAAALIGCALGGVGGYNVMAASEWMATSKIAQQFGGDMLVSSSHSISGLPLNLPQRVTQAKTVTAMADSGSNLLNVPGVKLAGDVQAFRGGWSSVAMALTALEKASDSALQIHQQLVASASSLKRIGARLEPIRSTSAAASALDSASRLEIYAQSGFGPEAGPRLAYDLNNLAYQVRVSEAALGANGKETRQAADAIYQAIFPLASQLAGNQPSNPDVSRLIDALRSSQPAITALSQAANGAQATSYIYASAGLILVVAGAISMAMGVVLAVSEYGSRYRKSLAAFSRGESAMGKLAADASAIADGNLNVDPSTDDETTSEIAESLARIARNTRSIQHKFLQHLASMRDFGANAARDANSQAQHLVDQSRLLTECAKLLDETASNLAWIIADTQATSQSADGVSLALLNSNRALNDSIERMDAIRSTVQETSKRLKRVGEGSQAISASLDAIQALAEQTNVLAMNSALEAERAGQHGGGFKLIASEIKALSSRLEQILSRANETVEVLQIDAREATQAMELSAQRVASGTFVGEIASASMASARYGVDTLLHSCQDMSALGSQEFHALKQVVSRISDHASQVESEANNLSSLAQTCTTTSRNVETNITSMTARGA